MGMNETTTTVVGRIVTDINVRTTAKGNNLAWFSVISQERRYDPETKAWNDGERLFVSVSCWGWTALNVQRTLSKGDPVIVMGRVGLREYTSSSGEQRVSLDLSARAVGPDLSGCSAVVHRPKRDQAVEEPLPLPEPAPVPAPAAAA